MAIKYNPNEAALTWPEGVYKAHIEKMFEKTSKAGNEMIEVIFVCRDRERGEMKVWDYIVIPKGLWKLKKIADAIGKPAAFESGNFNANDYVGENLQLELALDRRVGYADRNAVAEYLPLQGKRAATPEEKYNDYATSMPKDDEGDPPF